MKHYLVLALVLCAAAVCYFVGLVSGVIVAFCVGAVLEGIFWFRLMHAKRRTPMTAGVVGSGHASR